MIKYLIRIRYIFLKHITIIITSAISSVINLKKFKYQNFDFYFFNSGGRIRQVNRTELWLEFLTTSLWFSLYDFNSKTVNCLVCV